MRRETNGRDRQFEAEKGFPIDLSVPVFRPSSYALFKLYLNLNLVFLRGTSKLTGTGKHTAEAGPPKEKSRFEEDHPES
jgi:hypothetical protein